MTTKDIIKTLDKKTIDRLESYVEEAKNALKRNSIDNVAYYRGHVYGYIDSLEDSGKIDNGSARSLRIYFGGLVNK